MKVEARRRPSLDPYFDLGRRATSRSGFVEIERFEELLSHHAVEEYAATTQGREIVEFVDGPARFHFDCGVTATARTVLATARPERPTMYRDTNYQRGYPLAPRVANRAVDRGHFISYSAGGLFGPNIFPQDRALNRGWSQEGRRYRELEQLAAQGGGGTFQFAHPHYVDATDMPEFVVLGVVSRGVLTLDTFRNRYDTIAIDHADALVEYLRGATSAQVGALGEETASTWLESALEATVVALGDSRLERDGGRQDLDLVAAIRGELIVFEVKSRYLSRDAGRLTRMGNLLKPRLRKGRDSTPQRQGSQQYVRDRIANVVETGAGYEGVAVRVIAVDLLSFLVQQFHVDNMGVRLIPMGPPTSCRVQAQKALETIVEHQGYL